MKYFIKTFGCQANKSDSERIAGDYRSRGYVESADWRDADEVVINTCAVRQRAEDRVKGFLVNLSSHFKDHKPKIILTGCMTHHQSGSLKLLLPEVDEILPISEVGFNHPAVRKDKKHAWIPISTGCNSFCTYCIVPYARGREKSRSFQDILTEVQNLASLGYSEITLLGQNVNSFGLEKTGIGFRKLLMDTTLQPSDLPQNSSQYLLPSDTPPFVKLIREISKISTIKKIGFMTSNPWDFWDELIDEIAGNPKIDRFIHLPIQSGSDRILTLMNRGYQTNDYLRLLEKIKAKIPDAIFGTDIIVGFPGETDADFLETLELMRAIKFQVAFIAQYSPRPGTAAWRLYPDDVPAKVKKQRWEILDDLINKSNLADRPQIR